MPSLRSGALDRRLCSFPFWQRRLWRTCQLLSLCHRGHPFLFSRPQYAQVFPLKPAPSWTFFAGLGSTNRSAISLLFPLLSDSRSVLATLFSPSSFLLPQSLSVTVFSLLQFHQATMGPRTLVSSGDDAADELARRRALLVPSAMPCSHSSLISDIHSCLFSDCRHTVSSKFFDTQVSSISTE